MALTGTYKIKGQIDVKGCYIRLRNINVNFDTIPSPTAESPEKSHHCNYYFDVYKDETCRNNNTILDQFGGSCELDLKKSAKGYAIQVYEYLKTTDEYKNCDDC